MPLEETVHIVPLGHEYDRAVIPFTKKTPDRVYLLTISPDQDLDVAMKDTQLHFTSKVLKFLEKKQIEVRMVYMDSFDLLQVLKAISYLIVSEKEKGNNVSVNMSACGRLTSIGASLAAMCHEVKLYYVSANRYSKSPDEVSEHGISVCEYENSTTLENFHVEIPESPGLDILVHLYTKEKALSHQEIVFFCLDQKFPQFDKDYRRLNQYGLERKRKQSNYLMKMDKGILTKLEQSGYISRKKVGNERQVSLTKSGIYVVCISGRLKVDIL
jgi:hypothetical protein